MAKSDSHFPTPNEFYRAQRPERFSDSVVVDKPSLDRAQLEYFLGTVTNRGQETAFENLARGLAERRIAPNLLPHTGPTGGGDSKVDSETLPVADALALGWFSAIGRDASKERWGFAFSAKKDWKPKLKSDVAKLVKTGRGYRKAFFITSQFVRDKERADLEDKLSAEHGIEVRILDRNWILDSVFSGQLQDLAIETLGLPIALKPEIRRGPRDTEREERLEELEKSINEALSRNRRDFRVVTDALRSATTARGLERPRLDVDGRFQRARDLASELDLRSELLRVIYQWAWTSFFWYEDYNRLAVLANEARSLTSNSNNAHELELVVTLFGLLRTAVSGGDLTPGEASYDAYEHHLLEALGRVGSNEDQPSNALHAQTLRLQVRLIGHPEDAEQLLAEMKGVIERAQPMIGYPFEETAQLITGLGPYFGDLESYGALFERVVDITGTRKGDVTAAQMLLKRGAQQLEQGHHLEAIRSIGRALGRLYKNETREDLIHGLYLAGAAYAEADLLWAARGALVIAASLATDDFHKFQRITPQQVAIYARLRWVELQLGRLSQSLEWHQLTLLAGRVLDTAQGSQPYDIYDGVLGIAFLRADLGAIRELERLPDILEELGLYMAEAALLFALGHPSELPDEMFADGDRGSAELEFMKKWRDQPAAADLRPLSLGVAETTVLESDILGCHVEVTSDAESPALDLAESVLAGLESLLSTALDSEMIAQEPVLKIRVTVSEFAKMPFGFRINYELGRPLIHVAARSFDPHSLSHEEQGEMKKALVSLLVETFANIVTMRDEDEAIEQLFGREDALHRAADFTSTFVSLGNVLGHHPKINTKQWLKPESKTYALSREVVWDASDRVKEEAAPATAKNTTAQAAEGTIPKFSAPRKHSQIHTISLIREKLWNEAGWSGVGYVGWEGKGAPPPTMALLFRNPKAAVEIFEGWREDLGDDDQEERLRIAVIRGVSVSNPAHYRVVIGTEFDAVLAKVDPVQGRAVMMSRVHIMEPATTVNLDRFIKSYEQAKSYILAPGVVDSSGQSMLGQPSIRKSTLHIREAWQIGRDDPDGVGIHADDAIVVPKDQKEAPVVELQSGLKKRKDP
jgi:hypothetical protein